MALAVRRISPAVATGRVGWSQVPWSVEDGEAGGWVDPARLVAPGKDSYGQQAQGP